jgi:integrin alpha FG-GAP repeat containing protein 1
MEGVIPNSKVVIIPPAAADGGAWRKELYLRPGEWIPWVTLTVVVATIVLAVIVFVLHLNEKVCPSIIVLEIAHITCLH